ncbi:Uncharacterised protein [Chryseobacterium nakagawai]|uniref:Uncharacterized protein n=1 Tax=Chryseobacterium nakagawai TaxID=1241982 RepID=A0AAD1DQB4_CHRNA|nr:hypothetical protein [Chryseobacterium nakagawai]AZA89659.1 hypothetical protein EG343_02940 [Chryseobacterium nakagawai]VEH21040.1 Uncharacterised protein [Chryseobacterium nakagawai]
MKISFETAKRKLSIPWFTASSILFIIMFMQTIGGKFEDKNIEAWGWFTQNLLPTLSLIITVFVTDLNTENSDKEVEKFYFNLAFGLSIFYLLVVLSVLLAQPLSSKGMIPWLQSSSIYLGPFQGLVAATVGMFFLKKVNKD